MTGDDYIYLGYRVRWLGWREPVNQLVVFGVWAASNPPMVHYATTLGSEGYIPEGGQMYLPTTGPWISPFNDSYELRADLKTRARLLLESRLT